LTERRMVFVTIPPLLSDIIAEVARDDTRLNLVAQFAERDELAARLPVLAPDFVLVGLFSEETDDVGASILSLVPTAHVLALSNDGRHGYLYQMRPQRTMLENFSPADLLALLDRPNSPPAASTTSTV
jgi:hypothetical protein